MNRITKKHLLPIVIPASALALGIGAHAAVGDVVGSVYPTDIKTYVFGSELNSYNIGGFTCIVVEDLLWLDDTKTAPIDVTWDAERRELFVKDHALYPTFTQTPAEDAALDLANRGAPLYPDGYFLKEAPTVFYESDIKTIIDTPYGKQQINSYNIGGYTCIVVEDLLKYGYHVTYDDSVRELRVMHKYDNAPAQTDIGGVYIDGYTNGLNLVDDKMNITVGEQNTVVGYLQIGGYNYNDFVELNAFCEATGLTYSFDGHNLAFSTANAKPFTNTYVPREGLPTPYNGLIYTLDIDSYTANGVPVKPTYTYWFGHMHASRELTADMKLLCLNGKVYAPIKFLNEILTQSSAAVTSEGWTVGRTDDAITLTNGVKYFAYSPKGDRLYNLKPQLDELSSCTLAVNGGRAMLTYPTARESELEPIIHSAVLLDLETGEILCHYRGDTLNAFAFLYDGAITPIKKESGTHPGYSIICNATVDGKGFDLNFTLASAPELWLEMRCDIIDPSVDTGGQLVPVLSALDATSVELLDAYKRANAAYDLYYPCSPKLEVDRSDSIIYNGNYYERVTDERTLSAIESYRSYIDSLGWTLPQALARVLRDDVDAAVAGALVTGDNPDCPNYIEQDGKLYRVAVGKGINYNVGVTLSTVQSTDSAATLELTVTTYGLPENYSRTHQITFAKSNASWYATSFTYIY